MGSDRSSGGRFIASRLDTIKSTTERSPVDSGTPPEQEAQADLMGECQLSTHLSEDTAVYCAFMDFWRVASEMDPELIRNTQAAYQSQQPQLESTVLSFSLRTTDVSIQHHVGQLLCVDGNGSYANLNLQYRAITRLSHHVNSGRQESYFTRFQIDSEFRG
ncbi:hypothetical protein UY3_18453 [Chelonia mydas]|uniref:Uncharacterized protein n=1 Tax=Chelonia mydas TaxID=8469 RepID=M7AXM1_CHEMY|nr:hypothetical protein UY3_18453 [Chelonia mydas]